MITASLWRPGSMPEALSLDQARTTADGMVVLAVDASLDSAEAVHRELQDICGEQLTPEMVTDLLDPDELPEVTTFGVGGRIRKVSSFGVTSLEQGTGESSGLVFEPIEFLAGDRWMIYHWQHSIAYRLGLAEPTDAESLCRDDIQHEVEERWVDLGGETTGDLGVLFLYQLARQYSRARRALWTRLTAWEREFYSLQPGSDPTKLVQDLKELHRLHGELYRRLDGLNVPPGGADAGLFGNVVRRESARAVDEIVDRSLRSLRTLSDSLRQAVSLTQSYATLRHFELAEEQTKQTKTLQHRFELVALILLVPTLIAGIYGANTLLPGGGHRSGFIAMVILVVIGGGAAFFVLENGRRRLLRLGRLPLIRFGRGLPDRDRQTQHGDGWTPRHAVPQWANGAALSAETPSVAGTSAPESG